MKTAYLTAENLSDAVHRTLKMLGHKRAFLINAINACGEELASASANNFQSILNHTQGEQNTLIVANLLIDRVEFMDTQLRDGAHPTDVVAEFALHIQDIANHPSLGGDAFSRSSARLFLSSAVEQLLAEGNYPA